MPQSHLAPVTSLHGVAHRMCACMVAEPLLLPLSLLCRLWSRTRSLGHMVSDTRSRAHGLGLSRTHCLGHKASDSRSRTQGLGHTVSDTRSRTPGLGHTVSDTRSRTHGPGHTVSDTRSRTHGRKGEILEFTKEVNLRSAYLPIGWSYV